MIIMDTSRASGRELLSGAERYISTVTDHEACLMPLDCLNMVSLDVEFVPQFEKLDEIKGCFRGFLLFGDEFCLEDDQGGGKLGVGGEHLPNEGVGFVVACVRGVFGHQLFAAFKL